jgi:acyl carrier protein
MSNTTSAAVDTVESSIIAALSQVLNQELTDVSSDTRLFEDLNLDSTSVLELLMVIEEELDCEFDPDTLQQSHFATIGSLSGYVRDSAA